VTTFQWNLFFIPWYNS